MTGVIAAIGLLWASPLAAQRLPIRHYTVSDGLANNQIHAVMQDSLGYLWFATGEGVSRFDGYTFISYTTGDGLPHPYINDITEDRFGHLWVVGARGGIARLVDEPASRRDGRAFARRDIGRTPASNIADLIRTDREGRLWSVTDDGVYRGAPDAAGRVTFEHLLVRAKVTGGSRWFEDSRHRTWLMLDRDLLSFSAAGTMRYGAADGIGRAWIVAMTEDAQGRILAANSRELYEFVEPDHPDRPGAWRRVPLALGPQRDVRSALFDRTGRLWIATTRGVLWWQDGRLTQPTMADLPTGDITHLFIDRGANLWLGTRDSGLYRIAAAPVASYGATEGLTDVDVRRVVEDPDGRVVVATNGGTVAEIRQHRAVTVPGSRGFPHRLQGNSLLCDTHGNFWFGTDTGEVFFLPAGSPDFQRALAVPVSARAQDFKTFTTTTSVDAAGGVWIGGPPGELIRAHLDERGRPVLDQVGLAGHWASDGVSRVAIDRSGARWISSFGQLGRIRNGTSEVVRAPGTTETLGRALYVDSRGWLWVGLRYDGAMVSKNPTADVPVFDRLTTARGLSSDTVWALTEDRRGRIYFGTARAVDRFDPVSGEWWRLSIEDGLAGAPVMSLLTDRRGRVWIGSSAGLSVYDPEAPGAQQVPSSVLLTRVRIDGRDQPIAERGTRALPHMNLPAGVGGLLFEFVSVAFGGERGPRYQYQLDGADREWSPPTADRSVTYARLAPGAYTFLVRAIGADGRVSEPPAAVSFTIPTPIWRRPWFVGLGLLTALGVGAAVQRFRVRQVLAMERIRRQVALDLHDDIGSGLSQIAIMSDAGKEDAAAGRWDDVGTLARGLRGSMSDIVWAVDPRHDSLADLVRRIRQVSVQMLEAAGVAVTFDAPNEADVTRLTLAPDRRRHVLLIFKEAVHNVTKHAGARTVRISVTIASGRLELGIEDDGRGFEVEQAHDGHGLDSLRRRATELRADLRIESTPGAGTLLRLSLPLS